MEVIISHAHRFVFVKTRKTAGTSMQKYLQRFCDPETDIVTGMGNYDGENWNFKDTPFGRPPKRKRGDGHMALKDILEHAPEVGDYYRFAVERNPWDKCISMWWWRKGVRGDYKSSGEFLRSRHLPQDWDKYTLGNKIAVDDVLLYEDMKAGIRTLRRKLKLPLQYRDFARVHINSLYRPEGDDYRTHYTDGLRKIIAGKFRREIRAFGYEF